MISDENVEITIFLVLHFLLVRTSFKHISSYFPCCTPCYKKELFLEDLSFF